MGFARGGDGPVGADHIENEIEEKEDYFSSVAGPVGRDRLNGWRVTEMHL